MTTRFDTDTAVSPLGPGRWAARIDPGWWVVAGPNGGYVAALLLRGLEAAVGDASRAPRSFTVHYTAPPREGPAEIETRIERTGRSLTTVTGRLLQDGALLALAIGAFSKPREGHAFEHARMPEVRPPEECPTFPGRIPLHDRFEQRWAVGTPPFGGGEQALSGGWIRLAEPHLVDAPLAAVYTDAFPPAIFSRLREGELRAGVPTVDLSIHFRSPLPLPGAAPGDFTLAVFRSRVAREGFLEEDGELWTREGRLIAQSRQLAILR